MRFKRIFRFRLSIILVLALISSFEASEESDSSLLGIVEDVLLIEGEEDVHAKDKAILEYSVASGLSLPEMAGILETIVLSTLSKESIGERDVVLLESACHVLGELGADSSIDVLRKATSSASRSIRVSAMLAYIKLAKDNCLPFAEEVVARDDLFDAIERNELYKAMAPFVEPSDDPFVDARRSKVRSFFLKVAETETRSDCAKKLDEVLLVAFPLSWKDSIQRHMLATRFKDCEVPSHARYFTDVFADISKIPEGVRKNLMHELERIPE